MSAKDDVPPDSSQWRSAPGAIPPGSVHCLGFRNCRAIGNCGRGSDNGARPDDLPALAPGVARSTDLIQATLWGRQFLCLRPRPLPSGRPPSHQCQRPRGRCLFDQQGCRCVARWEAGRASRSARKRVRKVSVAGSAHAREKAREGRAGGQLLAVEQGHEGLRKGEEPLVKLLQGAFATDGVARSGRRESRSPRSAQSGGEQSARGSADGVEDAQFTQMLDDEHDFPQPTGGRGDSFGSGLDAHRRISDTGHVYLLVGKILYPSLKGGTFYAYPLQTISRCAIRGRWMRTRCLQCSR